ncbi:MAG: sugar ABC transporter permease [Eubacteriales bacterium]|nr:sugar ABC transporter permease [Eubacteriales bacterium]
MPSKKSKLFLKHDSSKVLPRLLLLPGMVIIALVFVYPICYALLMSFHKVNVSNQTWSFAGISNYIAMFKDQYFLKAMGVTAKFTVLSVSFEMVIGTLMAVLLNQNFKGRGFVRGIMIIPWALPTVVNAIMWKWIFNANYGAFNALLTQLNLIDTYKAWLARPDTAFNCLLFANVWKETPYVVLLVLAGLQSIPHELYEAASVDGCGPIRGFFKITIPMIKQILLILLITKTIWTIQTYDVVSIMTAGGPASSTQLISYYVQKMSFKFFDFGVGSAMAFVIMLITFILSVCYVRSMAKNGEVI